VLQRSDVLPQPVGEPMALIAAAAVANAFFDATGVRMRTAPFTPSRVRAALKGAAA
jgi:nicotinate dehydrogenase subunit B